MISAIGPIWVGGIDSANLPAIGSGGSRIIAYSLTLAIENEQGQVSPVLWESGGQQTQRRHGLCTFDGWFIKR